MIKAFSDKSLVISSNITQTNRSDLNFENVRDLTLKAILIYRNHPSILAIKEKDKCISVFTFNDITKEYVMKEIKDLYVSKASQENEVPTNIIKKNADISSIFIYQNFNNMIDICIFPAPLKLANITPVFKKGPKNLGGL